MSLSNLLDQNIDPYLIRIQSFQKSQALGQKTNSMTASSNLRTLETRDANAKNGSGTQSKSKRSRKPLKNTQSVVYVLDSEQQIPGHQARPSSKSGGGGFYKLLVNMKREKAQRNTSSARNTMQNTHTYPTRNGTPSSSRYHHQDSKMIEGEQIMVNELLKNMKDGNKKSKLNMGAGKNYLTCNISELKEQRQHVRKRRSIF